MTPRVVAAPESPRPPLEARPHRIQLVTAADAPSVEDLLRAEFGLNEIGGPSAFGWHVLKSALLCKREAYLKYVERIRAARPNRGTSVGSLLHACLALHYRTGGLDTFRPLDVVKDHHPDLAAECRRLLDAYFTRYARQEAATWDVRAIEFEAGGHFHYTKGHRRWKIPRTCRYDLIVALHENGRPCAPPGPVADGVYIVDHKTTRSTSRIYLDGWGLNGQILTNCLVYKLAGLEKVFGPLRGFIVNVIVKTKEVGLERLVVTVTDEDIARFARDTRVETAELWIKLQSRRHSPTGWPTNVASCVRNDGLGAYLCEFFDHCKSHGQMSGLYERIPGSAAQDAPTRTTKDPKEPTC